MTGPRQPRILLLSPHPDDIAWSLGGVVSRLREAGAAMAVVTFFGRSRYAPGSAAHGSLAATHVRAAEEDAWAALAGVTADRGDLPDASLRGYDDLTEMGAEPESRIVQAATERLRRTMTALRPHLILAPLAAGGHVDHSAVRMAVSSLRPLIIPRLAWYEDLPYAEGHRHVPVGDPAVVDVSSHWSAKEAGVRCFPSQLPQTVLPVLRRHAEAIYQAWGPSEARRVPCPPLAERLWTSGPQASARLRSLVRTDPELPPSRQSMTRDGGESRGKGAGVGARHRT